MCPHFWGDAGFDWKSLNKAQEDIYTSCIKEVNIRPIMKEK